MIDVNDPAAMVAEAERRRKLREQGASTFVIEQPYGISDKGTTTLTEFARGVPSIDVSGRYALPLDDERVIDETEVGKLEKEIEHRCDRIVLALNGRIVRFSHPGATKQTPGIADRIYAFPRHQLITWWEHKTESNEQSAAQRDFEQVVTTCGHEYHAGGLGDFKAWLMARGVVIGFEQDGTPIPAPIEARA